MGSIFLKRLSLTPWLVLTLLAFSPLKCSAQENGIDKNRSFKRTLSQKDYTSPTETTVPDLLSKIARRHESRLLTKEHSRSAAAKAWVIALGYYLAANNTVKIMETIWSLVKLEQKGSALKGCEKFLSHLNAREVIKRVKEKTIMGEKEVAITVTTPFVKHKQATSSDLKSIIDIVKKIGDKKLLKKANRALNKLNRPPSIFARFLVKIYSL